MKIAAALILCLISTSLFSQEQQSAAYYLNSEQIDIPNVYLNPTAISDMRVEHKTNAGEIYMKTKRPLTFLSLDEILDKYPDLKGFADKVICVINGKVVADKSKVKVDNSFFIQVEIKRLDKVNYVAESYRDLILAEIKLLTEKPKPEIRIR